ncbi:hypothetical protein Smp_151160 [Schistosoma mansoni]|uniref:hypothetical protein n=1 Tax=Schistosoma mansoni TaxID=6183 RepID=UPI0001A63AE3|nr:hypothetical protein Smp_151160 [Schistosoma mansoni]|eukprot:XP_018646342.1 hypothetical protein Smp_151160 [Schistosoma mansoni]
MKIRLFLIILTIIIQCIPSILSITTNNQNEKSSSYYYVVRSPKIEKRSHTEDETLTHHKEKTKVDTASQTYTKTTNASNPVLSPASLSSSSLPYGNNIKKNNGEYNVKPNVTMSSESIYQNKNSLKYVKTVKNRREISETNRNRVNHGNRGKMDTPNYHTPTGRNNEQNYPSMPNTDNEQSNNQESNQYGKETEENKDFDPTAPNAGPMSGLGSFGGFFVITENWSALCCIPYTGPTTMN